MANWCNNYVELSGTAVAVQDALNLFESIIRNQKRTEKFFLPNFVTVENSFMIDIDLSKNSVRYRSKWQPNLEALTQIAYYCDVDYINRYDELEMGIFGEATYQKDLFFDVRLDGKDLQSYHYNLNSANYLSNGQIYEDEWLILAQLLENKKASLREFKTMSNITENDLLKIYGQMLPGDIILKFAEHKNFHKSKEIFMTLDDQTRIDIEDFLINSRVKTVDSFATNDKFIAYNFLAHIVLEWIENGRGNNQHNVGLSR